MSRADKEVFLSGIAGLDQLSLMTVADMTLDVNTSTGSDITGDGTPGLPFKTVMRAVFAVPHVRRHIITVRVFGGTYAESIFDGGMYMDNGIFSGRLIIEGQDWTTPVLGSGGITSGTLGSAPATGITRTVAGAVWTVNELKSYFVRITSGSLSGQYFPIAANGTGDIDLPNNAATLNGATFDIVTQAVTITRTTGLFASVFTGNAGFSLGTNGLNLRRVKLNSGSFYDVYAGSGGVQVQECLLTGFSAIGINQANFGAQVSVNRSYIQCAGGTTGINGNEAAVLNAGGSVIDGGATGVLVTTGLRFTSTGSGALCIQNATTAGVFFRSGPQMSDTFSTSWFLIRNNAVGMVFQSGAHCLAQFWQVLNNTSHGIQILANNYTTCHNSLHMFGCKIQGNGGDGIRVETSHNNVMFGGGGDISGNTGYGLRFGGSPVGYPPATHNSGMFDSTATMGTNTAGDITHDNGVTTKTIAQVRSDGFEVDANLFNRVTAV